ncbi:MAG: urease accessory UreF family protein [Pseudomonadota bacterium]
MADTAHQTARLAYWLSPAFPTGGFAYSHGLEYAFDAGLVTTWGSFADWLAALIKYGSVWCDGVLCSLGWRTQADGQDLKTLMEFGQSLAGSAERYRETMDQGSAFLTAIEAYDDVRGAKLPAALPYPVAVGAAAAVAGIDHRAAVAAYLNAMLTNLVQAALRLGRFGQADGVRLLARLEPTLNKTAENACSAGIDDIATSSVMADLCAMLHETHEPRIFIT